METDVLWPIDHAEFLHEVPDEYLADAMPLAKKIAVASGLKYYNILQVRAARENHKLNEYTL